MAENITKNASSKLEKHCAFWSREKGTPCAKEMNSNCSGCGGGGGCGGAQLDEDTD